MSSSLFPTLHIPTPHLTFHILHPTSYSSQLPLSTHKTHHTPQELLSVSRALSAGLQPAAELHRRVERHRHRGAHGGRGLWRTLCRSSSVVVTIVLLYLPIFSLLFSCFSLLSCLFSLFLTVLSSFSPLSTYRWCRRWTKGADRCCSRRQLPRP